METVSIFEMADFVADQTLAAGKSIETLLGTLNVQLAKLGVEGQLPPTDLEVLRDIIASRVPTRVLH